MPTNTDRAIADVELSLRKAAAAAILEGDVDVAQFFLTALRDLTIRFNIGYGPKLNANERAWVSRGDLTGKVNAIKAIRERIPGFGLKDAKDLVESEMAEMGVTI